MTERNHMTKPDVSSQGCIIFPQEEAASISNNNTISFTILHPVGHKYSCLSLLQAKYIHPIPKVDNSIVPSNHSIRLKVQDIMILSLECLM